MRGVGRLQLLFLFVCILPALSSASGFSDCYPSSKLDAFWSSDSWFNSNSYIGKFGFADFYSPLFDGSLQQLSVSNSTIMNGEEFSRRIPPGSSGKFTKVRSELDTANTNLAAAKEKTEKAHRLFYLAKASFDEMTNGTRFIDFGIGTPQVIRSLSYLKAFSDYVTRYGGEFTDSLSYSAAAFDSLNSAGSALSYETQGEYASLLRAGAGDSAYSGEAKETFFYAKSLLAGGGACADTKYGSDAIIAYFSSRPSLPDFSGIGFGGYLSSAGGPGKNSTISRLADLYFLLSEANAAMEGEYAQALSGAKKSAIELQSGIASLQSEDIGEIIEAPPQSGASSIMVGSSYGGIGAALSQAQSDQKTANDELALAASAKDGEKENYLSSAISHAKSSQSISDNAAFSLKNARMDAETAVFGELDYASRLISAAKEKLAQTGGTAPSASIHSEARTILDDAEAKFAEAGAKPTLGKKYAAYRESAILASQAIGILDGKSYRMAVEPAQSAVDSLGALVAKAKRDGIDVSFEEGQIRSYNSILASTAGADLASTVAQEAKSDRGALILRLYESFSYLEEKFASVSLLETEIAKSSPAFTCRISPYSQFFMSGKLDAERGAGSLLSFSSKLDSCEQQCAALLPSRLSAILSENAVADELSGPPVLGRLTDYRAVITSYNPTPFLHLGEIPFSVPTLYPLHASELEDGDALSDAYPKGAKTELMLPSISPGQKVSFTFEKQVQPAQKSSSYDECGQSAESGAEISRKISFTSAQQLPSLLLLEQAPSGSERASASYLGASFPLGNSEDGGAALLSGSIGAVKAGSGQVEVLFFVRNPYAAENGAKTYESLGFGKQRVSFLSATSAPAIDCSKASLSIYEPFSGISNLSASPQGGAKVLSATARPYGDGTMLEIAFSPLTRGAGQEISISYILSDQKAAVASALSQAEYQVASYNRTRDRLALDEARSLISAGRETEALSLLSKIADEGRAISLSFADRAQFISEKSELASSWSSAQEVWQSLLRESLNDAASVLSPLLLSCRSSIDSASADSDAGSQDSALSAIRKAKSEFSSSLAKQSWKYLSDAQDAYAKARAIGASAYLPSAQANLSEAERLYSEGRHAESLLFAARAVSSLSRLDGERTSLEKSDSASAKGLQSQYSALRGEVEQNLTFYSAQYSSLSTQSKRQLPFTPASAQSRLAEADRLYESSRKASIAPSESLAQANASLSKLQSLSSSLASAIESLRESASSSLSTAKAALSEAKGKPGVSQRPEIPQIESEVDRAEAYFTASLFADSLSSSDRALAAATALISSGSGSVDIKPLLLGAVSIAFIAGAAYYFMRAGNGGKKQEKKGLPKA